MKEKANVARGRPIKNKVNQILATPEQIAKAISWEAERKVAKLAKRKKLKHI